jgi:hypothetical protein
MVVSSSLLLVMRAPIAYDERSNASIKKNKPLHCFILNCNDMKQFGTYSSKYLTLILKKLFHTLHSL